MFAVLKTGGKQYKVQAGDVLRVEGRNSQRTRGHRQQLTLLRVTEVLASGADKTDVKEAVGTAVARRAAHGAPVAAAEAAPKKKAAAPKKAAAAKADAADAPAKKKPAAKKAAAAKE